MILELLEFTFLSLILFLGFFFFLYELSLLFWGNWTEYAFPIPEEILDTGIDISNKKHLKYLKHPYMMLQTTYIVWSFLSIVTSALVPVGIIICLGIFTPIIIEKLPKYTSTIKRIDAAISAILIAIINYLIFFLDFIPLIFNEL